MERRGSSFSNRYIRMSTKVEKVFFRLSMLGLFLMIASQVALDVPGLRTSLSSTDRLEGSVVQDQAIQTSASPVAPIEHKITVETMDSKPLPNAWVKINGVPVANFQTGKVTVMIQNQDKVEIDTSRLQGFYRFLIDHNDPAITSPTPGTEIDTSADKEGVIGDILITPPTVAPK